MTNNLLEPDLNTRLRKAGAITDPKEFIGVRLPGRLVERLDKFVELAKESEEISSRTSIVTVAVHEFLDRQDEIARKEKRDHERRKRNIKKLKEEK